MVLERESSFPCPVLTATSAKEKIIPASRTIIIPDIIGMGLCTGPFFPREIETEIFSALMAEFKEVLIQESAADLTLPNLHMHQEARAQGSEGSRVQVSKV